ncbi:MAG: hypothetical protein ACLFVH_14865, partial [Phycisphaerae bacterium]
MIELLPQFTTKTFMGKILRLWDGGFRAEAGVSGRAPPTNGKGNINKYAKRPALSRVPERFT